MGKRFTDIEDKYYSILKERFNDSERTGRFIVALAFILLVLFMYFCICAEGVYKRSIFLIIVGNVGLIILLKLFSVLDGKINKKGYKKSKNNRMKALDLAVESFFSERPNYTKKIAFIIDAETDYYNSLGYKVCNVAWNIVFIVLSIMNMVAQYILGKIETESEDYPIIFVLTIVLLILLGSASIRNCFKYKTVFYKRLTHDYLSYISKNTIEDSNNKCFHHRTSLGN